MKSTGDLKNGVNNVNFWEKINYLINNYIKLVLVYIILILISK